MSKHFSKKATWSKLLRFPLIFGGVLIGVGYGLINFKQLAKKQIEEGRDRHIRFAEDLQQRSKDNRDKLASTTKD